MKKYFWIIFATLPLAGSSCKKDFLELSQNPNVPTVTTPGLALSGALKTTADIVNGPGYVMYACWDGYMSWSTGFQPNVALLSYQITSATYDVWTAPYLNIANYNAMYNSTKEPYFQAMAKIMEVYDFQGLVDNYNDVPYTQALKGTAVLNPTYDKGSAIYDDLIVQLDAAIKLIQNAPSSAANPGVYDIMYGGKMSNWLKFANTLKLRIALRQSNISSKTAALKAAIQATQSIGYLDATNPAVVNPGYLNSDAYGGQESPLWQNYGFTQNGGAQADHSQYQANSYGAAALSKNGDSRDTAVYTTTKGVVISTNFGQTTPPSGTPSTVGHGVLKSATMNAVIMSGAEALFLQAEGVQFGYITQSASTPEQLYDAGILASYEDDYVVNTVDANGNASINKSATDAAAAVYIANVPYPTDGTAAQQEQAIITEKWKALAIYGAFEAFNELRRTGYPNDIPLSSYPGANPPNNIARIPYPDVEYRTNSGNVAAEGTINVFTSKIFWAQ